MKTYIPLSVQGIDNLIEIIERYKDATIESKIHELAKRLASEGVEIAQAKFSRAEYDGTNDVKVSLEERSEDGSTYAVVATGNATLFIEFGTGVYYSSPTHPEAAELGFYRGMYGRHQGYGESWTYKGEPGTHGQPIENSDKILTHGNRANMPMYITKRELEEKISRIAKEVFTID